MDKSFYKKIIKLIPSADLKNFVLESGFRFNDKDLLRIILNYAPTFDKKLVLFEEASQALDDKRMRGLAKKRIAFEKRQYDSFMQPSENIVYAIKIKTDDYGEDNFITKTFVDAVELIKNFVKYYEVKGEERACARYTLTKMTTNVPQKPGDFSYKHCKIGNLGECVLDGKYNIIYLDMYHFGLEVTCKSGVDCDECNRCINYMFGTRFPHFIKKYDLVAYYDNLLYKPKHLTYAIFDFDMEKCDCDSRVINIEDNPYIQNKNAEYQDEEEYYRIYDDHDHPSYFEIIKPSLESVPQKVLDDYNYAVPMLKSIEKKIAERDGT